MFRVLAIGLWHHMPWILAFFVGHGTFGLRALIKELLVDGFGSLRLRHDTIGTSTFRLGLPASGVIAFTAQLSLN